MKKELTVEDFEVVEGPPIAQTDLAVGEYYMDTDTMEAHTAILKCIRQTESRVAFEYIAGYSNYLAEEDGSMEFEHLDSESWYRVTPRGL